MLPSSPDALAPIANLIGLAAAGQPTGRPARLGDRLRSAGSRPIRLARATLTVIRHSLAWAFGYNVAAIPLAAAWLLNPLIAGAPVFRASAAAPASSPTGRTWQAAGPTLAGALASRSPCRC